MAHSSSAKFPRRCCASQTHRTRSMRKEAISSRRPCTRSDGSTNTVRKDGLRKEAPSFQPQRFDRLDLRRGRRAREPVSCAPMPRTRHRWTATRTRGTGTCSPATHCHFRRSVVAMRRRVVQVRCRRGPRGVYRVHSASASCANRVCARRGARRPSSGGRRRQTGQRARDVGRVPPMPSGVNRPA